MTALGVVPPTAQQSQSPPPPPLLEILTDEELEILRGGGGPGFLLGLAPRMVSYEKAAGFVEWISCGVFTYGSSASSLSPAAREMVIVSVAAAGRDTFVLSGHLYWALMEGLSVEQIADTLMTVGAYRGIDALRYSTSVFQDVLLLLKEAAAEGGAAATVFEKMKKKFPRY